MNKLICMMLGLMATGVAVAKLPPLSAEAAATAAETKAQAAWTSKVDAYKLCLSQDKVVARYRQEKNASAQPADATPPCADPGPYVAASAVAPAALSVSAGVAGVAADATMAPKK
ncbi:MAG: hypothetical protein ABI476_06610 [Oxalobacteraceae bacterium]